MIQRDLAAARKLWIKEAETYDERSRREESDFLCYKNREGLFEFSSLRNQARARGR